MKIVCIAGFAAITRDPTASVRVYREMLGLPLKALDEYAYVDNFDGTKHFGVWPLRMAAQSCFGTNVWPAEVPEPHATIEFELSDLESLDIAVQEMKQSGQSFVHEVRLEPWGQSVARFVSPEGLLIGLTYSPWLHGEK